MKILIPVNIKNANTNVDIVPDNRKVFALPLQSGDQFKKKGIVIDFWNFVHQFVRIEKFEIWVRYTELCALFSPNTSCFYIRNQKRICWVKIRIKYRNSTEIVEIISFLCLTIVQKKINDVIWKCQFSWPKNSKGIQNGQIVKW